MLEAFDVANPAHLAAAAQLWTVACGPDLSISQRFVAYNVEPHTGKRQAGQLVVSHGQPAGFVLASVLKGDPSASSPERGYIDALAVAPTTQRRGHGRELLSWAEGWLHEQGCTRVTLGAGFQPFVPGVPDELGTAPFFIQQGYKQSPRHGVVWDMSADLSDYDTPSPGRQTHGVLVRPARAGDEETMLGFLRREFNGGWRYECEELLRAGIRLSDYILLFSERGIDGCCLVSFEDSLRPLDRFYMHRLPHPWGQLGSIGVSVDRRGQGYGSALLDGGLRHLGCNGVRGCVIDWLVLVDFYARFGFRTFRKYIMLSKEMDQAIA